MTAEVAILNREAVALAADSAVTISGGDGQKIFATANKLFQLSRYRPVGVMIYGASGMNDVGWETIIKAYRDRLDTKSFGTLGGYVDDFLSYLHDQRRRFFPEELQKAHFRGTVSAFLRLLRSEIDERVTAAIDEKGSISSDEVAATVHDVIVENRAIVMRGASVPNLPSGYQARLRTRYGPLLEELIGTILAGHVLDDGDSRNLRQLLFNLFMRTPKELLHDPQSGVVFAGFGDDDVFPRLQQYVFEGVTGDFVKCSMEENVDIALEGTRALVVPFAQREMVFRFMEGVDPYYEDVIENIVAEVLAGYPEVLLSELTEVSEEQKSLLIARARQAREATLTTMKNHLAEIRRVNFWEPVARLVDHLPKEELGAMAEALVNLTSFKRRVSWDAETVGGPIDVAVISRGDGFIWIKRKHYFKPELNPGFMANRYGGAG